MEIRGRGEEGVLDGVQERVTRNDAVLPKSLAGVHSTPLAATACNHMFPFCQCTCVESCRVIEEYMHGSLPTRSRQRPGGVSRTAT